MLVFKILSFLLLLVTFVALLIAVISSPITSISVGKVGDYALGVFGYCSRDNCSKVSYPYSLGSVGSDSVDDWLFSATTRTGLAKSLILVPISAGIVLISLVVTIASFFVSAVRAVAVAIAVIATVLAVAVAVLIPLMMSPHVAWAGWLVVGGGGAALVSLVFLLVHVFTGNNDYEEADDDVSDYDKSPFGADNFTSSFDKPGHNAGTNGYAYHAAGSYQGSYDTKPFAAVKTNSAFDTTSELRDFSRPVSRGNSHTGTGGPFSSHEAEIILDDLNANNSYDHGTMSRATPATPYDSTSVRPTPSAYNTTPSAYNTTPSAYNSKVPPPNLSDNAVLVNGPNSPISRKMAPELTPKVATPVVSDVPSASVPSLPYPSNGPLNKPSYGSPDDSPDFKGYDAYDDGISDISDTSNFTSVSQRAINPRYEPPTQYGPAGGQYGQTGGQYGPASGQYGHQFNRNPATMNYYQPMNQMNQMNQMNHVPNQMPMNQMPMNRMPMNQMPHVPMNHMMNQPIQMNPKPINHMNIPPANRYRPTASDNALANNPVQAYCIR